MEMNLGQDGKLGVRLGQYAGQGEILGGKTQVGLVGQGYKPGRAKKEEEDSKLIKAARLEMDESTDETETKTDRDGLRRGV